MVNRTLDVSVIHWIETSQNIDTLGCFRASYYKFLVFTQAPCSLSVDQDKKIVLLK
jgi:hypothetical protein